MTIDGDRGVELADPATTSDIAGTGPAIGADGRLSTVPSQRPPHELDVLPSVEREPRRWVRSSVVAVAVLALAGSGFVVADKVHEHRVAAQDEAERSRAARADAAVASRQRLVATDAAFAANQRHAQATADAALTHAQATLAAAPDADAGLRDALTREESNLETLRHSAGTTTSTLGIATGELVAADQRVADAEAAYQAAAAAAAAAAQAAAEAAAAAQAQAAAQAAAAQAAQAAKPKAAKPATKAAAKPATPAKAATSSSSGTAALASVPAGGLQCTSAGSGASAASASALGDAINAYRASHGLPTLAVVGSSTLTDHALQMANTGGIWHSGHDNIVGCVSNGSYSYLVSAWDASPPHRAQMQRTGITTMQVGAALRGGWLYGAAYFS